MRFPRFMWNCVAALVCVSPGSAATADPYAPPAGYYDSATETGPVLKAQLNDIISPHVFRNYDMARQALHLLDQDPANPANIILVYTGASVPGVWDSGVTWNREHTWPRSLGVGTSGPDNADMHHLRPCNPTINNSRGNQPFGIGTGFWDPSAFGAPFRGEMARTMFYMETRYDGTENFTENLTLTDGFPGPNQMGDKARLLEWHYLEPPNERERRRNHLVYSSVDNPTYFQGNRNPFVDRMEFVWAIWGPFPNDSMLAVDEVISPDGGSSTLVDFGSFLVGAAVPPQSVQITKTGDAPTTFSVVVEGDAASDQSGIYNAFISGPQTKDLDVRIQPMIVAGPAFGMIIIDNTDLTSAGTGMGAGDADDFVIVSGLAVDHASASFSSGSVVSSLAVDLGTFESGSGIIGATVPVWNLVSTPGATASLELVGVDHSGDTTVLGASFPPGTLVAAGELFEIDVALDTDTTPGMYSTICTISVADEPIPGAMVGPLLQLTLSAQIIPSVCEGDADGSGAIDLDDVTFVILRLGQSGEPGTVPGDVDENGVVDLNDVSFVLLRIENACK